MYSRVLEEMRAALEMQASEMNTTEIISHTLYEYNLEENKLIIQDFDTLIVSGNGGIFLPKGILPIKRIRLLSNQIGPVGVFYKINIQSIQDGPEKYLKNIAPYHGSEIAFKADGPLTSVNLILNNDIITMDGKEAFAFYIRYEIPIRRGDTDEMLFFSGAIQPSDYKAIREKLNVIKAKKIVKVVVWRKEKILHGWTFSGSNPNNFPPKMRSSRREYGEALEWQIEETINPDWDRARYFSIVAAINN